MRLAPLIEQRAIASLFEAYLVPGVQVSGFDFPQHPASSGNCQCGLPHGWILVESVALKDDLIGLVKEEVPRTCLKKEVADGMDYPW